MVANEEATLVVCLSDTKSGAVARSPSVLQKNTKLYGPMNVLDYENETSSWNSEGNHQDLSVTIDFKRAVLPQEIRIQFQAGFAAETCTIYNDGGQEIDEIEPRDVHEVQSFRLETSDDATQMMKLAFSDCTDFFDRVIVYRIEVWGRERSSAEPTSS